MNVVASFWEEHCCECAVPVCYGTCGMFERGWHGRCVRTDGFEESVLGTGVMRFRRWGKIELMYHGRMTSDSAAERIGRINRFCRRLWRLLGKYHRAFRWRLTALCGRRGAPNVWRLRMTSERDETLCAAIAYEDGREVFRVPLSLKAGVERAFELVLPPVETGALFRLFPLDGEATGSIRIVENAISARPASNLPPLLPKCVAWDLDGVIWDGTLSEGEDVKVRPGVMETVKALDAAGVVSSVCSKNDESVAIAKLKELGIEEWFVFPQVNWGPKSESLKNLAKEMNIGLDSIAFVDDREENREEVRANCPGVRVLAETELAELDRVAVAAAGAMGSRRRTAYREEMARRGAAKAFAGDAAAFAEASGLAFELLPVEGERIDRCRELVQRTNQLNLTARRYSELTFAALLVDAKCQSVHVWDKYGDYGIVGFLAMKGTHLVECCFSCRSAGRGIERKVLAKIAGGKKLTADIVETERNAPIRDIIREFVWQEV